MSTEQVFSLFFALGGVVFSFFSALVPRPSDLRGQVSTLKANLMEKIALELNVLLRTAYEINAGNLDEPLRGDGRESKDYVLDFCAVQIRNNYSVRILQRFFRLYRFAHLALFAAIILLLFLPLLSLKVDSFGRFFDKYFYWFIFLEIIAAVVMYWAQWRIENHEQ